VLCHHSPVLRRTTEPILVEHFVQHVAVYVVDVETGIDDAGHPAQRAAAMLVR
jgi:type VI protein secretion system component VasF